MPTAEPVVPYFAGDDDITNRITGVMSIPAPKPCNITGIIRSLVLTCVENTKHIYTWKANSRVKPKIRICRKGVFISKNLDEMVTLIIIAARL
jgi:hypothetical protein